MSQACVVLAAGQGRRLGGRNKALLSWRGQSFLARVVSSCREASVAEIVVVVASPHEAETRTEAERLRVPCVVNPAPAQGMGSSVAVGFQHALHCFTAEHCWLWPVDLPGVHAQTLRAVWAEGGAAAITMPVFEERGGHPVLLARSVWPELAECATEPEGARSIVRRTRERVLRVPVLDRAVRHDVDRPEDLASL